MTVIDEIEKYIPKSMALYDKELLLDNIKIILDEHKFTTPTSPAVKGVDELIEKMKEIFISFHGTQAEERGAERMYNYIMSEINSLKQIPTSPVDELIKKWKNYLSPNNDPEFEEVINKAIKDLKSLKQTPVNGVDERLTLEDYLAIEDNVSRVYYEITNGRVSKRNTCASDVIAEYHEVLNGIVEEETEEIIKDSHPKEVDIKDKKEKIYFKCDCGQRIYRGENYCKDCGAKIKWIA